MKEPLLYILESIVCSGLFYAILQLFIIHHTSYRVARRFLLAGIILSCAIPLFQIPVWQGDIIIMQQTATKATNVTSNLSIETPTSLNLIGYINIIYVIGVSILLINYIVRLFNCKQLHLGAQRIFTDNYCVIESQSIKTPFSFLRTIYLPEIDNAQERKQILAHEESHIRHHHSQERIILESIKLICWFNPFVWFTSRKLVEIQEMEADSDVLSQGYDITCYQMTLLKQIFGVKGDLVCNLVGHPMKKRLLAMSIKRTEQNARVLVLIPFLVATVVAFAFVKKPNEVKYMNQPDKSVSIVTDIEDVSIVSGKVTDKETGLAIIGAVLRDKVNKTGVVTDQNGRFTVKAKKGSTLDAIYPDYKISVIVVGKNDKQEVNLALEKETQAESKSNSSEEKQSVNNAPLALINGKLYVKSLDDISTDKITAIKIIKNEDELRPYIEKFGEQARNGVIDISVKE